MATKTAFTVIGAGHGGKPMAAHLALMGFNTTLYNRTPEHVAAIKELSGIDLDSGEGGLEGFGKLACVTSNIAEALEKAEMIMVVVPSSVHGDVAKVCAPHLKNGQIIVLHPGRTCGAIEFMAARAYCVSGCVRVSQSRFRSTPFALHRRLALAPSGFIIGTM